MEGKQDPPPEMVEKAKKMSTQRIQLKLMQAGYEEEAVLKLTREQLISTMAEVLAQQVDPEAGAGVGLGFGSFFANPEARADYLKLRQMELQVKEREIQAQAQARNVKYKLRLRPRSFDKWKCKLGSVKCKPKLKLRNVEIQAQLEIQRIQAEMADREQRTRLEELKIKGETEREALDVKRAEHDYQHNKDESLAARTKRYGDIMKNVIPRMPTETTEIPSFFDNVENIFEVYDVPEDLQAKLLIPQLSPRARTLISRMSVDELASYTKVRDFLTAEFKLTPREYRSMFVTATRTTDETYTLLCSRLKNLLTYYCRARGCFKFDENDNKEKLDADKMFDLSIADRLKDTMSQQCLKYCLAIEGDKTLSASEIANLADTYSANYFDDGRYKGNATMCESQGGYKRYNNNFRGNKNTQQSRPNQGEKSSSNVTKTTEGVDRPIPKFNNNGNVGNQNQKFGKPKQQGCYICGSLSHYKRDHYNANGDNRNAGNSGLRTAGIHAYGATNDPRF